MSDLLTTPPEDPAAAAATPPAAVTPPPAATPPDPTAVTSPATATAFNPDGTFGEAWWTAYGDELAPHAETAQRFKNPGDLLKSYMNLRTTGATYPDDQSTPEQVERFRTLANVPSTPEAYNLAIPEALPAGLEFNKELAGEFAAVAHKHHVPAPALQALMAKQIEVETARATEHAANLQKIKQEAEDALVAEWRGDFSNNKSTVRHWTTKMAESTGVSPENAARLANDPDFGRIMLQVSRLRLEDPTSSPNGLGDLRSPADRAEAIRNGSDPQWGQKYLQGDKAAYDQYVRLFNEAKK
jgi:hypothetical protein